MLPHRLHPPHAPIARPSTSSPLPVGGAVGGRRDQGTLASRARAPTPRRPSTKQPGPGLASQELACPARVSFLKLVTTMEHLVPLLTPTSFQDVDVERRRQQPAPPTGEVGERSGWGWPLGEKMATTGPRSHPARRGLAAVQFPWEAAPSGCGDKEQLAAPRARPPHVGSASIAEP